MLALHIHWYLRPALPCSALSRLACESSEPRNERRHLKHVALKLRSKFLQCLALFLSCKAHIHPNKNRKHCERQQSRPLQQKTEHDEHETIILRMPHIGVGARGGESVLALHSVKDL